MATNHAIVNRFETELEVFAAELTDAAFPIALQHGVGDDWLEMKLELWKALGGAVQRRLSQVNDRYA